MLAEVTSAVQLLQIVGQHRKPHAKAAVILEYVEFALMYSAYDCLLKGFRAVFDAAQLLGDVVPDLGQ